MKAMRIFYNKNGSALQIVLIVFMILLSSLSLQTNKVKHYSVNYHLVSQMMLQKKFGDHVDWLLHRYDRK